VFKAGGPRNFELFWRHQVPPFDREAALTFLRGAKGDKGAVSYLRALLAERGGRDLARLDDDGVVAEVANLIASGDVFIGFRFQVMTGAAGEEVREEAVARPAEAPRAAPRQQAEDPPTLRPNNDAAAQARVLTSASERGVPFCEECARAAAAQQQGAVQ
jgi:hypothetical protein